MHSTFSSFLSLVGFKTRNTRSLAIANSVVKDFGICTFTIATVLLQPKSKKQTNTKSPSKMTISLELLTCNKNQDKTPL